MVILDLSGAYDRQDFWKESLKEGDCLKKDLQDIEGTCYFCSDEALPVLRKAVSSLPLEDIHFIGSGDYHYLSLFFLERIDEEFIMLQIDHHSDCRESAFGPELLSCGGWAARAADTLPLMKQVWLAGPGNEDGMLPLLEETAGFTCIPEEGLAAFAEDLVSQELPVYISVDKDILSPEYAQTGWSQGTLTDEGLVSLLEKVFQSCRVIGMDVCGEALADAAEEAVSLNNRMNRKLADIWKRFRASIGGIS